MQVSPVDVQSALARHDPVGAWQDGDHEETYAAAAVVIAGRLPRVLGVGHILTITADALDEAHPGIYRESRRSSTSELSRRLRLVARELWDARGVRPPIGPSTPEPSLVTRDKTCPPATDSRALTDWLRALEEELAAVPPNVLTSTSAAAKDLQAALPELLEEYTAATDEQRSALRDTFSRFRLVLHQLSGFAGQNFAALEDLRGKDAEECLRRAVTAESLLDQGTDWRDELLSMQWAKQRAIQKELPFSRLVTDAAALSSPKTAEFLLQVLKMA